MALTVDHSLHPDSARWTAEAETKARALGADWRALKWESAKPATGLPAAARQARHTLVAEAARTAGARVVLMGHTASDIAEGEIMRATDAPGLGRLREWSPSPIWPEGRGVFLLRPLLGVSRGDLRAFLTTQGERWLDDPANDDPRHPRVRARQGLRGSQDASPAAPDPERAIPMLARRFILAAGGGMTVPRSVFAEAPPGAAAHVLGAALLCISGSIRPPRGEPLRRLLFCIASDGDAAVTLAGCRIALKGPDASIARQAPRRGAVPTPCEPAAWIEQRFAAACGLIPCEAGAGEAETGAQR